VYPEKYKIPKANAEPELDENDEEIKKLED
jgi:hypothetical protein